MADYEWSHEMSISTLDERTAEDWLRATWEDGPRPLRILLPFAWRYGLGLRLGSRSDPSRILGWHVAAAAPHLVTVDADSRIMRAENSVHVDRGTLRWHTVVDRKNLAGRVLWAPAGVVHQWLVPRLLRRAIRVDQHGDPTFTG